VLPPSEYTGLDTTKLLVQIEQLCTRTPNQIATKIYVWSLESPPLEKFQQNPFKLAETHCKVTAYTPLRNSEESRKNNANLFGCRQNLFKSPLHKVSSKYSHGFLNNTELTKETDKQKY